MMRIVMTIVPPGGTYTPPPPLSGGTPIDAGTSPADAGASAPDAEAPAIADAAAPAVDAAMPEPVKQDAATSKPPATKQDAASPPSVDPEPEPTGGNKPASKSGGCAMAGSGLTAGPLLLVATMIAQLRRRRRR
jgi:hypothetical protein